MAEIIVAPHAGFCFGVKRAISLAERVSVEKDGKRIWSMGPLIHNPQEVQRLMGLGVEVMASEEDAKEGDTVIIRSHGIPPQKERELLQRGLKLVDATCPYVKAVHQAVERLVQEGYFVVLVGEGEGVSNPQISKLHLLLYTLFRGCQGGVIIFSEYL